MSRATNASGHQVNRRAILKTVLVTATSTSMGLASRLAVGQNALATVHDDLVAAMKQAPLRMQFRGTTAKECTAWQTDFRAKLNELLGDSNPPKDWQVVEESRTELPDHVRYELLLKADGVPSVPLYLLVPIGLQSGQKVPAVVCPNGHGTYGHDLVVGRTDMEGIAEVVKECNCDYGLQFVRRGYVVAAPCSIPFGRRIDKHKYVGGNTCEACAVAFARMQALGQLPITANLRDVRWTIDFLQQRPEVIADRIGCAGLSYGGRMTMLAAAVDERICVAAPSGILNLLQERLSARYSCGAQIIPGLLEYGDFSEVASLIAPRPCSWETGTTDPLIVPVWDELFRDRLRRAYRALGAADQLQFDSFEGGHVWNGRQAFQMFDKVLRG